MHTLFCAELLQSRLLELIFPAEVDPVQVSQQYLILELQLLNQVIRLLLT